MSEDGGGAVRIILSLEDDAPLRMRLVQAMERRGLLALPAESVAAARAVLVSHVPTDAVLDLRMPGEPGPNLIPELKACNPLIRVVVLTGFGSIPAATAALRSGAKDFLTKPADAEQILAALDGQPVESLAAEGPVPTLDQVEWDHIQRVLAETGYNISATARLLGIDRRSLQRKLAKYSPH